MDIPKPPHKPTQLLNDLESIRELLDQDNQQPPLLIDSLDPDSIPVLSDIVSLPPELEAKPVPPAQPAPTPVSAATPYSPPLAAGLNARLVERPALQQLDSELRSAAQLILQDVIDDFVPQIEAELKRRLEARLQRLQPPRKG
ncbi:DNA polymerase III subunit chi [Pseudomonas sp. NCCP-436]|uniref:DNA polymerase III subunit chi n=1 Tax=Pseudomonas sp. NCCP-436 TaxID=2842481 RepID=UPI001C82384B|nr:DNA polymerase III subunit chi [Pseudomonas sp. NCCP-436]GIZ11020.1 hypothetical protein NCCP436_04360 [Pseudomonas sp. NCCP-436]